MNLRVSMTNLHRHEAIADLRVLAQSQTLHSFEGCQRLLLHYFPEFYSSHPRLTTDGIYIPSNPRLRKILFVEFDYVINNLAKLTSSVFGQDMGSVNIKRYVF